MKCLASYMVIIAVFICVLLQCEGQREPTLPVNLDSFQQILRTATSVPRGRSATLKDIIIRHYGTNTTNPTSYLVGDIKRLLADPNFNLTRPTVLYGHGYVELTSDESVLIVIRAYLQHGGYNVLALDWSNLAFGNYLAVTLDLPAAGKETAKAMSRLLKKGLSLEGLHFVGHSMGVHLLSVTARFLAAKGFKVPRLTGLDPAYPGFYPPLLAPATSRSDAQFVDIIHTDGGGFGTPSSTGHADFWPNEGRAKQPGCISATLPFSDEDFCSHWRSWAFWAESVNGGEFLARKCVDYDTFLRGQCREAPLVYMGSRASPDLSGNFYLRTAAREPYALGEKGAD